MKESIGGTWIFTIVIAFLALFTTFVSVSTNYSRIYKIKDEVLTALERNHGINENSIATINAYMKGTGYSSTGKCPSDRCWYGFKTSGDARSYHKIGTGEANYCITKYKVTSNSREENKIYTDGPIGHPPSAYYGVVLFFKLEWPILRSVFSINITGETSMIYMVQDYEYIQEGNC